MKRILSVLTFALAGCASNSGIIPIGTDTYMVTRQAATGFSGSGVLKAEAFQEANAYCRSKDRTLQVVSTNEAQPPYVFGNYPKAEVQFMCLTADDAELARPKLKPAATIYIETQK